MEKVSYESGMEDRIGDELRLMNLLTYELQAQCPTNTITAPLLFNMS